MNILVFSDSHGHPERIEEVLSRQIATPDAVFFLGDGLRDLSWINFCGSPLYSVRGNCDLYSCTNTEEEIFTELGGIKIFAAHGHRYSVKSGYVQMAKRAALLGADVMLFGHTHMQISLALDPSASECGFELDKKLYVMNPGSIGRGEFGVLTVRNRIILPSLSSL